MRLSRNDTIAMYTVLASAAAYATATASVLSHNGVLTGTLVTIGAVAHVLSQLVRVQGAPSIGEDDMTLSKGPFAATVAPIASPTLVAATVAPISNPSLVATVVDPNTLEPVVREGASRMRAAATLLVQTQAVRAVASQTSTPVISKGCNVFSLTQLITDATIAEAILGDITAFVGGSPVTQTFKVAGNPYTATVLLLPNGPTPQYQPVEGSFFNLLGIVLNDAALFQAGQPVTLAVKIGNTWYGVEFGAVLRTPATEATSAVKG